MLSTGVTDVTIGEPTSVCLVVNGLEWVVGENDKYSQVLIIPDADEFSRFSVKGCESSVGRQSAGERPTGQLLSVVCGFFCVFCSCVLSVSLSVCLSVCVAVFLPVCLPVCILSSCPRLSVRFFVCVSLVCPSIFVS